MCLLFSSTLLRLKSGYPCREEMAPVHARKASKLHGAGCHSWEIERAWTLARSWRAPREYMHADCGAVGRRKFIAQTLRVSGDVSGGGVGRHITVGRRRRRPHPAVENGGDGDGQQVRGRLRGVWARRIRGLPRIRTQIECGIRRERGDKPWERWEWLAGGESGLEPGTWSTSS